MRRGTEVLFCGLGMVSSASRQVAPLRSSRKHSYPAGTARTAALAEAIGLVAWQVLAFWLHRVLIGVAPFGKMGLAYEVCIKYPALSIQ